MQPEKKAEKSRDKGCSDPFAKAAAPAALAILAVAVIATPAFAQEPLREAGTSASEGSEPSVVPEAESTVKEQPDYIEPEIVVTAPSIRGRAKVKPVLEIGAPEIEAYARDTIGELIEALAARTGTAEPVLLVNGKRAGTGASIGSYPPESIERIEVLPPDAAAAYGLPPEQQVLNVVLKKSFVTWVAAADAEGPTAGGRGRYAVTVNKVRIVDDTRTSIQLKGGLETALLESERNIPQPPQFGVGTDVAERMQPNAASFRTIFPETRSLEVQASMAKPLGNMQGIVQFEGGLKDTRSLLGLSANANELFGGSLRGRQRSAVFSAKSTVSGGLGKWQFELNAGLDYSMLNSRIDQSEVEASDAIAPNDALLDPEGRSRQLGRTDFVRNDKIGSRTELSMWGPVVNLPAGPAALTVSASSYMSRSKSAYGDYRASSKQHDRATAAQLALSLPLSVPGGALAVGSLSLRLGAGIETQGSEQPQKNMSYSTIWQPVPDIILTGSMLKFEMRAPSEFLQAPLVETPNVRIFDFASGRRVDILQLTGGNPGLAPSRSDVFQLQLFVAPRAIAGLTVQSAYRRGTVRNDVGPFPALTADVEAAFPGRVQRDAAGEITRVDARAVNITSTTSETVRTNAGMTFKLGAADEPVEETDDASSPSSPKHSPLLLRLGLIHDWTLRNYLQLKKGLPKISKLTGDFGVSAPRHKIVANAALGDERLGVELNLAWSSSTRAVVADPDSRKRIDFSSRTRIGIRTFASLAQLVGLPWAKGMRVSFEVENALDSRVQGRDANGIIAVGFSRDELDPIGRLARLSVRRLF